MSSGTVTTGALPGAGPATSEQVTAVSQELVRNLRLMHIIKTEMAAWVTDDGMDWGAHAVLSHLVKGGAKRQSELAGSTLLDPSTISRRVSQLVSGGFVERRPDPADGRAAHLVATEAGQDVFDRLAGHRNDLIARLFDDWTSDEVDTFVALYRRLNDRLESIRPELAGMGPSRGDPAESLIPADPPADTTDHGTPRSDHHTKEEI